MKRAFSLEFNTIENIFFLLRTKSKYAAGMEIETFCIFLFCSSVCTLPARNIKHLLKVKGRKDNRLKYRHGSLYINLKLIQDRSVQINRRTACFRILSWKYKVSATSILLLYFVLRFFFWQTSNGTGKNVVSFVVIIVLCCSSN